MPVPPVFTPENRYDFLSDFVAGQNNGADALILVRNQAHFLRNATVRGGFVTQRPAYRKPTVDFQGDEALQAAFQTGQGWQGGAYYQDDLGNQSFVVSIAGRLFQLFFDQGDFFVYEITIPGDANPAGPSQAWMWQAEKWLIINDGQSVPIFFDGETCRRARQGEDLLGTDADGAHVIPALGASVTLNITSNFLGVPNMLVRIRKADKTDLGFFQTLQSITAFNGYQAILTNQSGNAVTVDDQSTIIVPATPGSTNTIGVVSASTLVRAGQTTTVPLQTFPPSNLTDGGSNRIDFIDNNGGLVFGGGIVMTYSLPGGAYVRVTMPFNYEFTAKPGYRVITKYGVNISPTPAYPVGTTNGAVTFAAGETKTIQLDSPYTGPDNQSVTINGLPFVLSKGTAPVVANQVALLNLTGTAGVAIPATATIVSVAELPPGRMGAYILGRNWEALTDGQSFIAGDIVNGVSGTPAFNRRDAVLHITENNLLAGGGAFRVPSSGQEIRAIIETSTLDTALGQGGIQIYTKNRVFSCTAGSGALVDRQTWQNTQNPILPESLTTNGAESQNSTVNVNSDTLFRSLDGIRSLFLGRKEAQTWGSVPDSFEVSPTLNADEPGLLKFSSAVVFNNRLLMTAHPQLNALGIFHDKLVALNFDEVSSLRGKAPSAYDGIWDGLNVLQLLTGNFGGTIRAFAFCLSSDFSKIELWELSKDSEATLDEGDTPIVWELESAALNFSEHNPGKRDFLQLLDGELRLDRLTGDILVETFYRGDQASTWQPWHSWTEKFSPVDDPGYRPALGLGEPPDDVFDETNDRPARQFSTMEFKLRVTGAARLLRARFKANTIPVVDFSSPAT